MATRRSAKGRIGGEGERFARIPARLLRSEAVKTLNHAAFKVLVVLASDCYRFNNGRLALTEMHARKFGFNGRDTLYRSLRELEARGLIQCTRRGSKIKNYFSLFALGWEPIYFIEGGPLEIPKPASNAWERWTAPSVPNTAAVDNARARARARAGAVVEGRGDGRAADGGDGGLGAGAADPEGDRNSYRSSGVVGPDGRDS